MIQLNGRILDPKDYDSIKMVTNLIDEFDSGKRLYRDDIVTIKSLSNAMQIIVIPNEKDTDGRNSPVSYVLRKDGLKVNKNTLLSGIEDILQFLKKIKRTVSESELRSVASQF